MVGVSVGENHRCDRFGIDAGGGEAVGQLAGGRHEVRPGTDIDECELAAAFDERDIDGGAYALGGDAGGFPCGGAFGIGAIGSEYRRRLQHVAVGQDGDFEFADREVMLDRNRRLSARRGRERLAKTRQCQAFDGVAPRQPGRSCFARIAHAAPPGWCVRIRLRPLQRRSTASRRAGLRRRIASAQRKRQQRRR